MGSAMQSIGWDLDVIKVGNRYSQSVWVIVGQCGQCEPAWVIVDQCELAWVNGGQCRPV